MRKLIAGLLAGVVLGTTGTAIAASSYWSEHGSDYRCEGVSSGMLCNSGGFQIGVTKSYVYIQKGTRTDAPTYACRKWGSWTGGCFEG